MMLEHFNSQMSGLDRVRGNPCQHGPVFGGNALAGPIRNGTPLPIDFRMARKGGRAPKGLEDLRRRKRIVVSEHAFDMPDNLASRKSDFARPTGTRIASGSGTVVRMPKKPPGPLQIAVSARLKAVQEELGNTDGQMATLVGKGRTTWANWINRENMPEEEAVIRLCDKASISMEWLYRGRGEHMPVRLFIRLELRMLGLDPDSATPEQMAPVAARVAASASS